MNQMLVSHEFIRCVQNKEFPYLETNKQIKQNPKKKRFKYTCFFKTKTNTKKKHKKKKQNIYLFIFFLNREYEFNE